jgi:uncharacterized DUF497 family protein
VRITWDEPKRRANLAKHGMDFADLEAGFFETARIVEAKLGRFKALGRFADGTIAVVFAALGTEAIAVISMRAASAAERSLQ